MFKHLSTHLSKFVLNDKVKERESIRTRTIQDFFSLSLFVFIIFTLKPEKKFLIKIIFKVFFRNIPNFILVSSPLFFFSVRSLSLSQNISKIFRYISNICLTLPYRIQVSSHANHID